MEICEACKRDFVPISRTERKNKQLYCSQSCRIRLWVLKQRRIQIEKGNYQGMTVGTLEKLGYKVTVEKNPEASL